MTDPSEKSGAAPKRDKFASMAATVASLPYHDELASMAAASQSTPSTETATVPLGEDKKLASMAVSHQAAAPRRDKFAGMIAAAAAAASASAASVVPSQVKPPTLAEKDAETLIRERVKQRDKVLKDLEQAEGWTWQLLNLASQTATSLSDLTADMTDISVTSHKYRETLQKIHSTLTPHAHLVVPYQNHQVDNKNEEAGEEEEDKHHVEERRINMYAARVDMRLAQERRNVLKELLRLEKESDESSSPKPLAPSEAAVGDKRKRDD